MRRHLVLAAALTGVLVVSACSSDTGTRRTVTAVVTVSSGDAAPSGSGEAQPSGSAEETASASPAPESSAAASSPAASAAPIVTGVDPLKVDCGAIISADDVKKYLNLDIPNDRLKVSVAEVNTDVGQTGSVRCLYGLSADRKSGQVTLRLTTYTDPTAAQNQAEVTITNETDNGAQVTATTVNGYPAQIALRDGGLIVMPYDNWTLAIAAPSTVDPATLTTGLPQLAGAALTRIIKS